MHIIIKITIKAEVIVTGSVLSSNDNVSKLYTSSNNFLKLFTILLILYAVFSDIVSHSFILHDTLCCNIILSGHFVPPYNGSVFVLLKVANL